MASLSKLSAANDAANDLAETMANRFACAASGLLEKYYSKLGPSLIMRPL